MQFVRPWCTSIRVLTSLIDCEQAWVSPPQLGYQRAQKICITLLTVIREGEIEESTSNIGALQTVSADVLDGDTAEYGFPAPSFSVHP